MFGHKAAKVSHFGHKTGKVLHFGHKPNNTKSPHNRFTYGEQEKVVKSPLEK